MASWNVAGIAEADLDLFYAETRSQLEWDVLCLQEAFVRTEGIVSKSKKLIYTPKVVLPGLRTPAIIVHEKIAGSSKFLASGARWVAAKVGDVIYISAHLPHATASVGGSLQSTLIDMSQFVNTLGGQRICSGWTVP